MKTRLTAIAVRQILGAIARFGPRRLKPKALLRRLLALGLIGCLSFAPMPRAYAQTRPALLKLENDSASPQPMSASELAGLNDPLFDLVLKDNADTTTLDGLTQRLGPTLDDQNIFVVHERILDDATQVNGRSSSRRGVLTFNALPRFEESSDGEFGLNKNNVMLSVFFSPQSLPSIPDIEAMAWDDSAGQFNYYKLNRVAGETAPTWKFRGNSKDADLLSVSARQGTCMACHINGGAVMKEFKAPWNNWDSVDLELPYLRTGNAKSWPVAGAIANRSAFGDGPDGAQGLESMVEAANERFNRRRIAAMRRNGQVTTVKRLLKPLFVTTEFNLMTSRGQDQSKNGLSGLHPFGPRIRSQEIDGISIPESFLFNDDLIGFRLFPELDFPNFGDTSLSAKQYQDVVRKGETTLGGATPGDAHFAWLTPEVGNIDASYVRALVEQNVVPREFVAAVLSVDLENPVFSSDRQRLWNASNILPSRFRPGSQELLTQTRSNLERLNPSPSSPEGQFLAALQSPDPVQFLKSKLDDYATRQRQRLNNPQVKPQEVARLYRKLLERRERVEKDPVLHNLNESSLLFPQGNLAALPDRIIDEIAFPTPAPAPAPRPTSGRPVLGLGDRGNAVQDLQEILQVLGFLNGSADGDFGPMTERSVIAAQRRLGLGADGIVGPVTWGVLERVLARPVLRIGSQGDDVVELQQGLRDRGFLRGSVDGDFGPQTRSAVISAQRQFELEADGVVGPSTWARLIA